MKKMISILAGLLFLSVALAQEPDARGNAAKLYRLSAQQFQEEEFAICYRSIETLFSDYPTSLLTQALSTDQQEHARFMQAASAFRLGRMDASSKLKQFLLDYPLSVYAPTAYFYLGSCAMNAGQYQDALEAFQLCPRSCLSKKDYEDFRFQLAVTNLQLGRNKEARPLLEDLLAENGRYVGSVTYYLAYIDYCEGHNDEALAGFRKVEDIEAYRQTAPYFIMQLLFHQGEYAQVLTMAERKLQENPSDSQRTEIYRLSGASYYELGNYSASQDCYRQYLAHKPDLLRSDAYRIGMNYFHDKRYTEATDFLSQATEGQDAQAQNAAYHLGVCYLQQQKTDMARMCFERASLYDYDRRAKEDALYNYALLCYETSFSPFDEQIKAFERILTEFPDSRYSDQIYSHLADAFLSSGNEQAAIDFIDKIDHPSRNMLETKSKLLFQQGMELFNNARYDEACKKFSSAISVGNQTGMSVAEATYWRGEAYYQTNHLTASARDFRAFLSAPGAQGMKAWPAAHYNLAYCYFNTNNFNDALYWFGKYTEIGSIRKTPGYADALSRIGDCYYYGRNYQRAVEYYQAADRESVAGNDYAVYQQAFSLGLLKKNDEKAALLAQFEKRFPKSDYLPQALFEQGRAYIATKRTPQAIAAFERLIQKSPGSDLARQAGIQTGLLYYQQGDTEKAIAAYKNVVSNYPGSSEAQTAVNDLRSIYVATNRVSEYAQYVDGLGGRFKMKAGEQDSLSYEAAERLLVNRQKTEALAAFQSYLKMYPQGFFSAEANYYCASLLNEQQRTEEAVPYYQAVTTHKGHTFVPEALVQLSEYSYSKQQYTQALDYYRQLDAITSDRAQRLTARTGIMRCLAAREESRELLDAASQLMQESNLSPDLLREARYHKAMSLIRLNRTEEAVADMETLAKESKTAYGAEIRYRLAQYYFDQGNTDKADQLAQQFLQEGTPHKYWMARCFVLLADINMQRGDDFQARQYLLSLKENYTVQDDIQEKISERLNKITERSHIE